MSAAFDRDKFLSRPDIREWVDRQVAAAPPLSEETRARLSVLLRPAVNAEPGARGAA